LDASPFPPRREVTERAIDVDAEFDINIPMFEGKFVHGFD
jgi:hypothetical protein